MLKNNISVVFAVAITFVCVLCLYLCVCVCRCFVFSFIVSFPFFLSVSSSVSFPIRRRYRYTSCDAYRSEKWVVTRECSSYFRRDFLFLRVSVYDSFFQRTEILVPRFIQNFFTMVFHYVPLHSRIEFIEDIATRKLWNRSSPLPLPVVLCVAVRFNMTGSCSFFCPSWMRHWKDYVGWNPYKLSSPGRPLADEPPGPITNEDILTVSFPERNFSMLWLFELLFSWWDVCAVSVQQPSHKRGCVAPYLSVRAVL